MFRSFVSFLLGFILAFALAHILCRRRRQAAYSAGVLAGRLELESELAEKDKAAQRARQQQMQHVEAALDEVVGPLPDDFDVDVDEALPDEVTLSSLDAGKSALRKARRTIELNCKLDDLEARYAAALKRRQALDQDNPSQDNPSQDV